jgi:hypothetical protein
MGPRKAEAARLRGGALSASTPQCPQLAPDNCLGVLLSVVEEVPAICCVDCVYCHIIRHRAKNKTWWSKKQNVVGGGGEGGTCETCET